MTVLGLGYVGLPLAVALARHFEAVGFDVNSSRICELLDGYDRTNEVEPAILSQCRLKLADNLDAIPASEFVIVTVPTPIDENRKPDLSLVEAASRTAGKLLKRSAGAGKAPIVIYESTVYPGVTEDVCIPVLNAESGLECGRDFFVGYSPERINPGDREHTIDKITKVVSGQNEEVTDRIAALYGTVTSGGIFKAASIKAAEAAKVIENAQRDINIAFMNEIAQIFAAMNLSVWDVLAAAQTKWNFLPFQPGLVGGHCIGVDPYYLSFGAEQLGVNAEVVLAGRNINNQMPEWVAHELHRACRRNPARALVLGLTFKENVPDLRNSKVADLIASLTRLGHEITVHDPLANPEEAEEEYDIEIDRDALDRQYDLVLLAVPHRAYLEMGSARLRELIVPGGILADLKNALGGAADWTL